ncbi:type I restriction endonuclease subunit S [Acinetobacter pittii]|nr:type I restriction endonuclease subunit S [Acinetobacter pittii]
MGKRDWKEYKFSEVVKLSGGYQPPKSEFSYEEKEGYIRLIQIRDYKSDQHKVFIPREKAKKIVNKNDIMIGRYGPPIFQILRGLEGAYNVALIKAEPNIEILDQEYLYWYLQNQNLFNYIDAGSDRTAGQTGINRAYLESYPLLLPSIEEQKNIVEKIELFFSFAKEIEKKIEIALNQVTQIIPSILDQALSGNLTKEWRKNNLDLLSESRDVEKLLNKISIEKKSIENSLNNEKKKRKVVVKKIINNEIIKVTEALIKAKEPLTGQELLIAAGYPIDSSTDLLEQFFLDIRDSLNIHRSIVKLEREEYGQDKFALAVNTNFAKDKK